MYPGLPKVLSPQTPYSTRTCPGFPCPPSIAPPCDPYPVVIPYPKTTTAPSGHPSVVSPAPHMALFLLSPQNNPPFQPAPLCAGCVLVPAQPSLGTPFILFTPEIQGVLPAPSCPIPPNPEIPGLPQGLASDTPSPVFPVFSHFTDVAPLPKN